ncbi:MAG: hypothetical protein HUU37_01710 [Bdellovibrionales bacterium]|nr:hypothetical protein [Bdellovibrionales bacterium]
MDVRSIAIVQLDGSAELIASAPAVLAIRDRHPKSRIHLVTSRRLLEVADLISGIDHVAASGAAAPEKIDLLVNLGFTGESLLAAQRLASPECIGPRLNQDSAIILDDGWSRYHEAVVPAGHVNPFHRAEILASVAGLQWRDPDFALSCRAEEALGAASRFFSNEPHIKVAVTPGALRYDECRELVTLLRNSGFRLRFYFLGILKDRQKISSLIRELGPDGDCCANLAGELGLRDTALLSQGCDVMIAPPGTEALLSSGFGTLTICPMERDERSLLDLPFGQGHLCVQAEAEGQSRGGVIAEAVAHAITANGGNPPTFSQWRNFFDTRIDEHIGKTRVFLTARSVVEDVGSGAKSELRLFPLVFSGANLEDSSLLFSRIQWESVLNEIHVSERSLEHPQESTLTALQALAKPLGHLSELAIYGQRSASLVANHIQNNRPEEANKEANKLQEIDELIRSISRSAPILAPISSYFFINQSQIHDVEPMGVAEKMRLCYVLLQHQAMLMIDLIAKSADPAETGDRRVGERIAGEVTDGQS